MRLFAAIFILGLALVCADTTEETAETTAEVTTHNFTTASPVPTTPTTMPTTPTTLATTPTTTSRITSTIQNTTAQAIVTSPATSLVTTSAAASTAVTMTTTPTATTLPTTTTVAPEDTTTTTVTTTAAPTTQTLTSSSSLATTTAPSGLDSCINFSPSSAPSSGQTSMQFTIQLSASQSVISVTIGNTQCPVTSSTGDISCAIPAGCGGQKQVVIIFANQNSTVCPGYFSYLDPTVTIVSPNRLPLAIAAPIEIVGQNFCGGLAPVVLSVTGPTNVTISTLIVGHTSIQANFPSSLNQGVYSLALHVGPALVYQSKAFQIFLPSSKLSITFNGESLMTPTDFAEQRTSVIGLLANLIADVPNSIYITNVKAGSVIVDFLILAEDATAKQQILIDDAGSGKLLQWLPATQHFFADGVEIPVVTYDGSSGSNNLPKYAIALIVILCVLGVLIAVIIIMKQRRRKRREFPLTTIQTPRGDSTVV